MLLRYPLLLTILASAIPAQDWPQLLGPTRNGVYAGPWSSKSSFNRVWKVDIGEGLDGVAVAQGRVLLFHRKGAQEILESLDAATGKPQWTFAQKTGYRDDFGFSEGPRAVPTVDGDRVFVYGAEGTLSAVDRNTGKKLWSLDARSEFGVRKEFFGAACSPVIEGDRLLMNIGGANGAGIVALDKATGKTAWKALSSEAGYSSPVVATIGGKRHAIFFTREGVVDADPANGKIRFEQRWRARTAASVNAAVPVVVGNEVFVSSSYNTGAMLLQINGDSAKTIWSGDESLSSHYSTAVYKDGYLYGFHGRQEMGQSLRCVEWKTGKVMWSLDSFGAGTVTLAGADLLVLRENGELQVGAASPKGFTAVKKVRMADATVRAYPALSAGRMYVRTDRELSAWKID